MKLTKKMHELFKAADLENGEINDVSMGTMYGLENRGLITDDWRMANSHASQVTGGRMFPMYRRVRLFTEKQLPLSVRMQSGMMKAACLDSYKRRNAQNSDYAESS